MHIAVCVKLVPNPDAPFSQFSIDERARKVVPVPGLQWVMSPFDEQAMEAALRIRDKQVDGRITAITLGHEASRNALKQALAMGADDGVLLSDAALQDGDGYSTALALAFAIRKLGSIDLVLTGRQAADGDAGVVGAGIAEFLGVPVVSFAKDVQVDKATVRVERALDDGTEVVEASLPAVVTVSNELGQARKASLRETMRAAHKQVVAWSHADLAMPATEAGAAGARCVRERVFVPVKDNRCEMVEGATPDAQAVALVQRLREAKAI